MESELTKKGIYCQSIRHREVMNKEIDVSKLKLLTNSFPSGEGMEYFISYEIVNLKLNTLCGFLRLRLTKMAETSQCSELRGKTALIRELHVHGKIKQVGSSDKNSGKTAPQHLGLGKKLIQHAEKIAKEHGYEKIAIISGIGVREYYVKRGYLLEGTYMVKKLNENTNITLYTLYTLYVIYTIFALFFVLYLY